MSSFLGGVQRDLGQATQIVRGVSGLANAVGNLLGDAGYGSVFAPPSSWLAQLQTASWRGIPFGVRGSEYAGGRRVAVHEYPFRDDVWVEDLGRSTRPISFSGFVVGDDCYQQAQALLGAGEMAGAGTMVHPSLGARTVALVSPIIATERAELGRVVELRFEFIETLPPAYPDDDDDTTGDVGDAADDTGESLLESAADTVSSVVQQGAAAVGSVVATVQGFASTATRLVGDAAMVTHAVTGLVAPSGSTFGRYASGSRGGLLAGISTVTGTLNAVVRARSAVTAAASDAVSLAGFL